MNTRAAFLAAFLAFNAVVRAEAPSTFSVSDFKFQRPPEWPWVEVSSPMRKAQLKVPGADASKAAEITFFYFGKGQGGDVQANAQRWLKQFQSKPGAEKIEPQEIAGSKVTLVSTEGTFASGMPGQPAKPMEDYALLGAILEDDDGPVFVKMTGPIATVKEARTKFVEFITAAVTAKK